MNYTWIDSPVGRLMIAGDVEGLRSIVFPQRRTPPSPEPGWVEDASFFTEARTQMRSYFNGDLRRFDLPLAPRGTMFQLSVWRALAEIPYGTTISYWELAQRIGNPGAVRAVGAANGANPLPIVVPCHRVIGADGSLTGYGGGLEIKEKLLALEGVLLPLSGGDTRRRTRRTSSPSS